MDETLSSSNKDTSGTNVQAKPTSLAVESILSSSPPYKSTNVGKDGTIKETPTVNPFSSSTAVTESTTDTRVMNPMSSSQQLQASGSPSDGNDESSLLSFCRRSMIFLAVV